MTPNLDSVDTLNKEKIMQIIWTLFCTFKALSHDPTVGPTVGPTPSWMVLNFLIKILNKLCENYLEIEVYQSWGTIFGKMKKMF